MEANSNRMSVIRKLCKLSQEKGSYDLAIKMLEKEVDAASDDFGMEDRCELFERLAIFYHYTSEDGHRAKEFKAIRQCMELQGGQCKFKLPYSLKILGDGYRRMGELDLALNIYGIALNHYGDGVRFQEIRALLSSSIAQIEAEKKAIKEAEDFKEKLRKELIEEEEKQKKKIEDKMVQAKEKEEQEKSKSFMEENIKEVEEPVCELEIEQNVRASGPPICSIDREFSASFSVSLIEKVGRNCYTGVIQSSSAKLPKSFVEASSCHINQLETLISLGRMQECLLNVEHSIVDPMDESKFLVTEVIYPLEAFFLIKYNEFKSSKEDSAWWVHISGMFWRIFRDVTRGLMFLYEKTDFACGDLSFNCFVTLEGRGRILPTLEHMYKEGREDVKQLLQLMRSVLYIPSNGKPDIVLNLPNDLTKLLDIIPRYLDLPPSFLVDLSIFWTDREKIDFSLKFKKLCMKNLSTNQGVDYGMKQAFVSWWEKLDGVYYEIYKKSLAKKGGVASYRRPVDIARFFNASYSQVNDEGYKKYWPGKKKLTDKEIERDLVAYFPNYYVTVFECLCISLNEKRLVENDLKELSSICFRDVDQ